VNTDMTAPSSATPFVNTYSSAPICFSKDVTTPANATVEVVTTTTLTITGTGTDDVKYICCREELMKSKVILGLVLLASTCSCQTVSGGFNTGSTGRGQGNQQQAPAPSLPPITFSVAIGSLTAPNTSACNSTSLASYCGFAYTGWSDARSSFTPLTNPYNAAPMPISKGRGTAGDVHNLTT
jgi:hypothetical protein